MPIYEYECKACGKQFEVWQKITDEPLKTCKECGGELIKLISESGFILKGTGWYVTDYARKEKEKKEKKENSASKEN
jgi:putative FmdB family regulatory protein